MIVNMYVDHLMSTPPSSANDVWNATRQHPKLFSDAAARIGMTPKEYAEFRASLVAGKAVYVRLPRKVDAMSGSRRGSVYAVKNAVMTSPQMGWRVDLADGNAVYVPQVCANLSFVSNGAVATVPHVAPRRVAVVAHRKPKYVQAIAQVPKETPVSLDAPEAPAPVPETPPTVAQAVPAGGGAFPFFAFIPAAVGGIIAGVNHGSSTPPVVVPPCNAGSNALGVCSK